MNPLSRFSKSFDRKAKLNGAHTGNMRRVYPESEHFEEPKSSQFPESSKNQINKKSAMSTPQKRSSQSSKRRFLVRDDDYRIPGLRNHKKKKSLNPEEFEKPFSACSSRSITQRSNGSLKSLGNVRESFNDLEHSNPQENRMESPKKLSIELNEKNEETKRLVMMMSNENQDSGTHDRLKEFSFRSLNSFKDFPRSLTFSGPGRTPKTTKDKGNQKSQTTDYFGLKEGPKKTLDGEDIDIRKLSIEKADASDLEEKESQSQKQRKALRKEFLRNSQLPSMNSKFFRMNSDRRSLYLRSKSRFKKFGFLILPNDKFKVCWAIWIFLYDSFVF